MVAPKDWEEVTVQAREPKEGKVDGAQRSHSLGHDIK